MTAAGREEGRRVDPHARPPQTPFTERLAVGAVRYLEAVSLGWYRGPMPKASAVRSTARPCCC